MTCTDFGASIAALASEEVEFVLKRAAGRPKDLEAIAELEALWEESNSDEIPVA